VVGGNAKGHPVKALIALATIALLAGTSSSISSTQNPQQGTQFRARTDVVLVPVSVMKDRNPVPDLTVADFEVTDNGVRQVLDAASLQSVALDVTLVVTEFSPDRDREFRGMVVSADATRKLLHSTDQLRMVIVENSVTGRLVGADYTLSTDPAVNELQPGVGIPGRPVVIKQGGATFKVPLNQERNGWGVALGDALFYALAWPVAADRRHLVIAFTDGWDTASALEMDSLPGIAGRSDAVLHAVLWATPGDGGSGGGIWTLSPPSSRRMWEESYRALDQSVQRTGGTLQRTQNAAEALAQILADFRSSYVLRYTPRQVPAPGWHEVKVSVKRPGSLSVRARKGYEAGPPQK
jgi:VWFA-related protein